MASTPGGRRMSVAVLKNHAIAKAGCVAREDPHITILVLRTGKESGASSWLRIETDMAKSVDRMPRAHRRTKHCGSRM